MSSYSHIHVKKRVDPADTGFMLRIRYGQTALLLMWSLLLCLSPVQGGQNTRVLIIHSYSQEYPWTQGQHKGFLQALKENHAGELVIETEYLDTKRLTLTPEYIAAYTNYIEVKYRGFHPTAIYVTDDDAFGFTTQHISSLFPGTPVFFSGVNDLSTLQRIQGRNITGVIEHKEIAPNLKLLIEMDHNTGNLLVIGDNSRTYQAIEREIRKELSHLSLTRTVFIASENIEKILNSLSQYPDSDIFLTTLGEIRGKNGRNLTLRETIRRIAESGHRLIISMEDGYVQDRVLGGYVTSSKRQGATAAGLLVRYLRGEGLPAPIGVSPNEYLFDYRELTRHGMSLPQQIQDVTTLLNPPETFYQRYRLVILALLYILAGLLLISGTSFLVILTRKNRLIRQHAVKLRQQAKIALRAKEGLDEAQRVARQGSWEWDLETKAFHRSKGLVHLYEMCLEDKRNSLVGFDDKDNEDMHQVLEKTLAQVQKSENSIEKIHHLTLCDGRKHVMQEIVRLVENRKGESGRLIGTLQDITEQYRAQTLLRENEEKYRRLFEMSEDPMVLIVDENIGMVNRAATRTLGFDDENQLIGMKLLAMAPQQQPDGQSSAEKAARMIELAHDRGYQRFEWEYLDLNGGSSLVEVSLTRIPYDGKHALYCIWHDIMEIKLIEQALKKQSAYLDGILHSSERVAIIATDPEGCIQYYNQTAEKLFGMPAKKVIGVNLLHIHRGRGVDNARNQFGLEQAREDGEYRFTMDMDRHDGVHYIDARVSPIYQENQEFAGYMLMCEDVTDQRRASELIAYQASYDALTDLPNRRMFLDSLQKVLARTRRHHQKAAVLFFDLDNFKNINDSLGHPVGDGLLRQVAQRMLLVVREEDTVARLGGDEFVILMSQLDMDFEKTASEVQVLADKIRQEISKPYHVDEQEQELHITTSIGIAIFPTAEESPDDILKQADTAMYRAKESGRNTVRFFLPSMQRAADERLKTLNELRLAIQRNELQLFYQAQFNVEKQLCGMEALVRWNHPTRGLVMPSDFIPLAEESSLILDVGDWVLHQALNQYKAWSTRYAQSIGARIAVNVSAMQFRRPDFINKIERALGNTGADPCWLTLEMTESVLLEDFNDTVAKIETLKQLGVRFSIDDFGTGYSSLAYLKRLPIDEIKIDRSFVRDILYDPNDAALVEAIITLAKQIGLETVAEGVESQAVFEFLTRYNCHIYQGFHLARPCDDESFHNRYLTLEGEKRLKSDIV
ncbi:MAG: EAL domain-containing protein [Candidatus Thiodiazotropha sp.]